MVTSSAIGSIAEPKTSRPKSIALRESEIVMLGATSAVTLASPEALAVGGGGGGGGGGDPPQSSAAVAELRGSGAAAEKSDALSSVSMHPAPARAPAVVLERVCTAPEPS